MDYTLPVWGDGTDTIDESRLLAGYHAGPQARQHLNAIWHKNANELQDAKALFAPIAMRQIGDPTIVGIPTEPWADVIWVRELGLFVTVATSGVTHRVATSPDGHSWTGQMAQAGAWKSVCWSPALAKLVAVGNLTSVMTSTDGVNWTLTTSALAANDWRSVCWSEDEGVFVAVASSGTDRVATSANGTTWTARSASAVSGWCDVVRSDALGLFIAVAESGTTYCMTSPTGVTWTSRAGLPTAANFIAVVNGFDVDGTTHFPVMLFVGGAGTGTYSTSTDGIAWGYEGADPGNKTWVDGVWAESIAAAILVASDGSYAWTTDPFLGNWTALGPFNLATDRDAVCWAVERGLMCSVASAGSSRCQVSR